MLRKRIIFRGIVQGVGFRATTASIARRHPVTGWVRNLRDGSVEAEIQGEREAIDAVLAEIQRVFADHIDDCEITDQPVIADCADFEVRR